MDTWAHDACALKTAKAQYTMHIHGALKTSARHNAHTTKQISKVTFFVHASPKQLQTG